MPRLLLAGLVALAAAAPAVANDDEQVPPPDCQTALRTESPCAPPPACEETQLRTDTSCPPPPEPCEAELRAVAAPARCSGPSEDQDRPRGESDRPSLKGSFLNRVWRFDADADAFDEDANVLNVTITKVVNLPRRWSDQDDSLVDADAYVLFSATTRVYDNERRRVFRETRYDGLLDVADTLRVVGKVVPPRSWQLDVDEMPTPTVRAKRVYVTG